MTASRALKRPLVYLTHCVSLEAQKLLPGVVLENELARAITRGGFKGDDQGGLVYLDAHGYRVRVARRPARLRPRPRAWIATAIDPFSLHERQRVGDSDACTDTQARAEAAL